jgi:tRNA G10  N-methylase Trm11
MSTYIFVLGKDRDLSLAELKAKYPSAKWNFEGDDFLMGEIDMDFSQDDLDRLGGTIKVAQVTAEAGKDNLVSSVADVLGEIYDGTKLNYGLSLYGISEMQLRPILIKLKKTLIEEGLKSRFINNEFKNISAAQFKSIREDGVEVVAAKAAGKYFIGKVVAVQDIDAYSFRDYEKPFRDMKVGMLPPKLAQILINLSGTEGPVWDPFCGGGVLIMEGLLMGRAMAGSDIDERVLDGAWQNVEWLQNEFNIKGRVNLFHHDATRPVPEIKFNAIVTEGYLGPPQNGPLHPDQAERIFGELQNLYVSFFSALKTANVTCPVVIALPFFKLRDGGEMLPDAMISRIMQMDFKSGAPLQYARPDQAVGRAIYKFNF